MFSRFLLPKVSFYVFSFVDYLSRIGALLFMSLLLLIYSRFPHCCLFSFVPLTFISSAYFLASIANGAVPVYLCSL